MLEVTSISTYPLPTVTPVVYCELLPESVENIFKEIGRVYVPALLANEIAFKKEEKTWEVPIDDSNWSQNTFPYQVKCLNWINDEFQKLDGDEKTKTLHFLEKTGCKELIRN